MQITTRWTLTFQSSGMWCCVCVGQQVPTVWCTSDFTGRVKLLDIKVEGMFNPSECWYDWPNNSVTPQKSWIHSNTTVEISNLTWHSNVYTHCPFGLPLLTILGNLVLTDLRLLGNDTNQNFTYEGIKEQIKFTECCLLLPFCPECDVFQFATIQHLKRSCSFAFCLLQVWKFVSHIKGRTQAEGVWEKGAKEYSWD